MKKLLLMFALLFSAAISSSPVRAEWTWVVENAEGSTHYIDLERIRKHDGYVYYWTLWDYSEPIKGIWSSKVYQQADCKLFSLKILSLSAHTEPMGKGTADTVNNPDPDWQYPLPPNSRAETILKLVCSQ